MSINWQEFKYFKAYTKKSDNFEAIVDFLQSYCRISSSHEIFEIMLSDDIAKQMLHKRDMLTLESFENYLFRDFYATKPKKD